MTLPQSSSDEEEDLPLRHRQSRVYDAEKIRQEFIKSQGALTTPVNQASSAIETTSQAKPDQSNAGFQDYLKSLDHEQLDQVLNEVLIEVRSRESEQVKRDVLTHSQKLRLRRQTE